MAAYKITSDIVWSSTNFDAVIGKIEARLKAIPAITVRIDAKSLSVLKSSLGGIERALARIGKMGGLAGVGRSASSSLSGVNKATSSFKQFKSAVVQSENELEKFARVSAATVRRFGAFVLISNVFNAVSNSFRDGVHRAIEFDKQMYKIAQVTGLARDSLKGMDKEITNLSVGLGVSSVKLTDVALTLAQAGLSAKDTKLALTALAKTELSATFDDIKNTTEGVIAVMSQFKVQAKDLESELSSINTVSARFAVESSDIVTAIRTAGGAFQAAGGNLKEFYSLFTSVRATTRESAESIATGLRTITTRLQRPRTQTFLKEMGVDLTEAGKGFIGIYPAIEKLSSALKNISGNDPRFSQILEEIAGYRQIAKVIPLLRSFETAQKALGVAQASGNSLSKDAIIAQQSLANAITKTKEEFDAFIRKLVDDKAFKTMAIGILNVASAFIKMADSIRPLIPLLTIIGGIYTAKASATIGKAFVGDLLPSLYKYKPVKRARGGFVPGSGSGDTVPAMLEPGEFVIRKSAAQAIGPDGLHKINKYAGGGIVKSLLKRKVKQKNKYLSPITNHVEGMRDDLEDLIFLGRGGKNKNSGRVQNYERINKYGNGGKVWKSGYRNGVKIAPAPSTMGQIKDLFSKGGLRRSLGLDHAGGRFGGHGWTGIQSYLPGNANYANGSLAYSNQELRYPVIPNGKRIKKDTDKVILRNIRKISNYKGSKRSISDKLNLKRLLQEFQAQTGINPAGLVGKVIADRNYSYRASDGSIHTPLGSYTTGSRAIVINPSKVGPSYYDSPRTAKGALYHELGHAVDNRRISPREFSSSIMPNSSERRLADIYKKYDSPQREELFKKGILDKQHVDYRARVEEEFANFFSEYLRNKLGRIPSTYKSELDNRMKELLAEVAKTSNDFAKSNNLNLDDVVGLSRRSYNRRKKFAAGGHVPGSGDGDTVPAMLTPGEFVINKKSAQAIGYDKLAKANRYAGGGIVNKIKSWFGFGKKPVAAKQMTAEEAYFSGQSSTVSNRTNVDNRPSVKISRDDVVNDIYKRTYNEFEYANMSANENKRFFTHQPRRSIKRDSNFSNHDKLEYSQHPVFHHRDLEATHYYTYQGDKVINSLLRSGLSPKEISKVHSDAGQHIPVLDRLIKKSRLSKDATVYRGLSKSAFDVLNEQLGGTLGTPASVGKVFSDKAYQSVSTNFDVARRYAETTKGAGGSQHSFKILLKKGQKVLDLSKEGVTQYPKEDELLLGRGAKFKIVSVSPKETVIQKLAKGGHVPGSGSGDTVPALLTPGEFVINKKSAQAIGYDKLAKANKYATGGMVGKLLKKAAPFVMPAMFMGPELLQAGLNTVTGQKTPEDISKYTQPFIGAMTVAGGALLVFSSILKKSSEEITKKRIGHSKDKKNLSDRLDDFTNAKADVDIELAKKKRVYLSGPKAGKTYYEKGGKALKQQSNNLQADIDKTNSDILETEKKYNETRRQRRENRKYSVMGQRVAAVAGIGIAAGTILSSVGDSYNQSGKGGNGSVFMSSVGSGVSAGATGAGIGFVSGGAMGAKFGLPGAAIGGILGALYGLRTGFLKAVQDIEDAEIGDKLKKVGESLESVFSGKSSSAQQSGNIKQFVDYANKGFGEKSDTFFGGQNLTKFKGEIGQQLEGLNLYLDNLIKSGKSTKDIISQNEALIQVLSRFGNQTIGDLEKKIREGVDATSKNIKSQKDYSQILDDNNKRLESLLNIGGAVGDAERSSGKIGNSADLLDQMINGYGSAKGNYDFSSLSDVGSARLNDVREQASLAGGLIGGSGVGLSRDVITAAETVRKLPSILNELVYSDQLGDSDNLTDKLRGKLGQGFAPDLVMEQFSKLLGDSQSSTEFTKRFKENPVAVTKELQGAIQPIVDVLADAAPRIVSALHGFADGLAAARQNFFKHLEGLSKAIDIEEVGADVQEMITGTPVGFAQRQGFDTARGNLLSGGKSVSQLGIALSTSQSNISMLSAARDLESDPMKVKDLTKSIDENIKEAEKVTQALEYSADVNSRLAAANKELEKIQKARELKKDMATGYAFGDPAAKKEIVKGLLSAGQIQSNLGNGKNAFEGVSLSMRQSALELFKSFSDIKAFNGKTGQEMIDSVLKQQGFEVGKSPEETQAAGIAQAIVDSAKEAQDTLNKNLSTVNTRFVTEIGQKFDKFISDLRGSMGERLAESKKLRDDEFGSKAEGLDQKISTMKDFGKKFGINVNKEDEIKSILENVSVMEQVKGLQGKNTDIDSLVNKYKNKGFGPDGISTFELEKAGLSPAEVKNFVETDQLGMKKEFKVDTLVNKFSDIKAKNTTDTNELYGKIVTNLGDEKKAVILYKELEEIKKIVNMLSTSGSLSALRNEKDTLIQDHVGRATGGPIWSKRGTDTVPAMTTDGKPYMLTPGEYVMNRRAVGKYGVSTLEKMNHLADGGSVYEQGSPNWHKRRNILTGHGYQFTEDGIYYGSGFSDKGSGYNRIGGTKFNTTDEAMAHYEASKSNKVSEFRNGKNPRIVSFGYKEPKFGEGVRLRRGIKARLISHKDSIVPSKLDDASYTVADIGNVGNRTGFLDDYKPASVTPVKKAKTLLQRAAEQHARHVKHMAEIEDVRRIKENRNNYMGGTGKYKDKYGQEIGIEGQFYDRNSGAGDKFNFIGRSSIVDSRNLKTPNRFMNYNQTPSPSRVMTNSSLSSSNLFTNRQSFQKRKSDLMKTGMGSQEASQFLLKNGSSSVAGSGMFSVSDKPGTTATGTSAKPTTTTTSNGLSVQMINPDLMKEFNAAINKLAGSKLEISLNGTLNVNVSEGNLNEKVTETLKAFAETYVMDKIDTAINNLVKDANLAVLPKAGKKGGK